MSSQVVGGIAGEDVQCAPSICETTWHKTEIWLIRHGESEGNASGRLQGQAEFPLSEKGRRQAQAVAIRLRGQSFAALYSSDLSRALDTACAIGESIGLPIVTDQRLREIDIGAWSGKDADDIARDHRDEWIQWCERRDPEHRRGGGESYVDLQNRVAPAITEIARQHPGERIIMVTHGGTINSYLAFMLGMPLDGMWRLSQENTCINRVQPFLNPNTDVSVPGGRVLTMNDTTHLDDVT